MKRNARRCILVKNPRILQQLLFNKNLEKFDRNGKKNYENYRKCR